MTLKPLFAALLAAFAAPAFARHLTLNGAIDGASVAQFLGEFEAQQALKPSAIVVEINSPGGSVFAGLEIARAFEHSEIPVVCVVDTMAASMAFYVLQSCTTRLVVSHGILMAHRPSAQVQGNAKDLEKELRPLRAIGQAMEVAEARRLKCGLAGFRKLLDAVGDLWLTADQALKLGAVDAVVPSFHDADAFVPAA